jgi:hypothetical protein
LHALARGTVRVPWPAPAELASIAAEAASRVAADEGVRIPGFARALAQRALGMIEAARARDWSEPDGLAALGAELAGDVVVRDAAGRGRRLGFIVDRADLVDGVLRLTDYKTGKPVADVKREDTKREKLPVRSRRARVAAAAISQLRRRSAAAQAEGRLLYLREDSDDRSRLRRAARRHGADRGVRSDRAHRLRRARRGDVVSAPRPVEQGRSAPLVIGARSRPRACAARATSARASRVGANEAARRDTASAGPYASLPSSHSVADRDARRGGVVSARRRRDEAAPPTPPRVSAAQTVFGVPLVLVAAGTGKTTVLVTRILAWGLGPGWERAARALPGEPSDAVAVRVAGGVVAITFTEAAAAEMEARAMTGSRRSRRRGPCWASTPRFRARWQCAAARATLLAGFDRLHVQTIHAFCRRRSPIIR